MFGLQIIAVFASLWCKRWTVSALYFHTTRL